MELPVTAPAPNGKKAQYIIKTKNLSYKLPPPYGGFGWWPECAGGDTNRYILRNVNCEAKPGEITAIAGPSGAGKTTLLDILAGMIVPSRVFGHVLVNGLPMDAAFFRRVSGYITQDEALFPLLTVKETLIYSARLRLEGGLQKAAAARAKQLLEELGLTHVADAKIGDDSRRGISGGEKRRVSIGIDLVHDPDVLLVDEPTSGLDSASAFHVISLLKSMANNHGKTIVLTIHQPGFRILELFDQTVLLCNGIVLHCGSLNLLEERLKLAGHSIPRHVNVLEFAIDAVESLLIDVEQNPAGIEEEEEEGGGEGGYRPFRKGLNRAIYCNSRFSEAVILSQRFSKNIFRTKRLFSIRMLQALLVGILLGTIFMNSKLKFQTNLGFFAFSLTFLMSSTTEALPILLREKRILMRETSRGAYRVSSYVIANTLVFLPFLLGVALLYSTPVYWLVGLRRDLDGFLYFSLVVWVVLLMSNSFVACFSALVPDFIAGTSVTAGLVGSFFLFSGYFIPKDEIPKYWIFMYYLSLFRYPFECFIINEYGGENGKGKCLESVGGACVFDSHGFLLQKGLKESQKWSNLAVMLGFILGYRFLCFMILWYRSYRTKG